jgi:alkylation response protein AidB-like acyl-CoA dehydrogenase
MDPLLSDDQHLLRETTERFIEKSLPLSGVRALAGTGGGVDESYRSQGAELGWFALLAPEALGGGSISGEGVADAAVLAEVRGWFLQPGSFVDTNVIIEALANDTSGADRSAIVGSLLSGEAAASWALAGPGGAWSGGAGLGWQAHGDEFRLDGRKTLVVEAGDASWLLATAEGPDGLAQFLVPSDAPGVTVTLVEGLDLTRRLYDVGFEGVELGSASQVGTPATASAAFDRQLALASVLSTAECVGAMDHLFELTVEYSKDRIAFGRPIGSFQAVKHQLADTSLNLEMSKAAATAAVKAVQVGDLASLEVASIAKSFVSDAAVELAHACWQNFGGIAYTWEHDFHLFLRRLTTDASLYGPAAFHRERICQLEGI